MHDVTATIAQLFIHPIKSCAGIAVHEAELTATGLLYDRHWVLVDEAGRFVTQREQPRMALIQPCIESAHLRVSAQGMAELSVPLAATGAGCRVAIWDDEVSGFDMGAASARWFSQFLGVAVRLVRFNSAQPRLCSAKWTGEHVAATEFADGYPLLVTTSAAVDELNDKLAQRGFGAVDARRFRPNIVLADLPAHDEDLLDVLHVGEQIRLKNVKPCERCPIPSIDPDNAVYQPEAVSDTMQTYRQNPQRDGAVTFGMNAIVLAGAGKKLRVGQTVGADYVF
ncbi:MAG: MOSC domain-containing protein [Formosimonas sp.]